MALAQLPAQRARAVMGGLRQHERHARQVQINKIGAEDTIGFRGGGGQQRHKAGSQETPARHGPQCK